MRRGQNGRAHLFSARRYLTFFLMMSGIITCCILSFLSSMERVTGIVLDGSRVREASVLTFGNVLGLALVKRVMDIVNGEISVESELGRGSSLTVKIRRTGDGKIQAGGAGP